MMKWFTDEAYQASDSEWDRMLADYSNHVAKIEPLLPTELAALAKEPQYHLHDAVISKIVVDQTAGEVTLKAKLGEAEFDLGFRGAEIMPDDLQSLAYAVGAEFHAEHWGDTITQILAQEVDVLGDGRFILRLRLWPFYAFGIAFSEMSLALRSRKDPGARSPGTLVIKS